jgi:branched-chain amino acid transport system ATP-binding protein
MALLSLTDLSVSYGSVRAVRGLNLRVEEGEIVTLLGANGSGKSSTLNAILGLVPSSGDVAFDGRQVGSLPTEDRVGLGLTLTPEGRHVFPGLTVHENLVLGGYAGRRNGRERSRSEIFELFPVLEQRLSQLAGTLSGGEQQQLAIARSLMSSPRLLLLDEPSLGLAPKIVDLIFGLIVELNHRGVTVLLVEQNVGHALRIASRGYVLSSGSLVLEGDAEQLRGSSGLERAYLGIGVANP